MEAVFSKDTGSIFSSPPLPKSFYCPTTPRETQEITPAKQQKATPTKPKKTTLTQNNPPASWDLITPLLATTKASPSSSNGSSLFNETWPSSTDASTQGGVVNTKEGVVNKEEASQYIGGTLTKYVERFRQAPPTDRTKRGNPPLSFWWSQREAGHVTTPGRHVTPSTAPCDHSTPDSISSKSVSFSTSSLETRSQGVIERSTSLVDSPPATKYLNSRYNNNLISKTTPNSDLLFNLPTDESRDDILHQWRLKRRLEVARREATVGGENPLTLCTQNKTILLSSHIQCQNTESRSSHYHSKPPLTLQSQSEQPPPSHPHSEHPPPSHPHSEQPPPSRPHSEQPPPSRPHSEQPPPSHPHSEQPPPSRPHNEQPPPSDPHSEQPPPSDPHSEQPPPSHPHNEQPPPSHPHNEHPPPSHSHSEHPPPSHPHSEHPPSSNPRSEHPLSSHPHSEHSEDSVSLSDFSLNFTTDQMNTSITVNTLVGEVIGDRLFGDLSPPLAHTMHSSTATPPLSTEITSKNHYKELPSVPWDFHFDDDLLKCLIKRAQSFEDAIRAIDECLAAMD